MVLSDDERDGLGIALNEADVLGVEIDAARRIAAATFRVLTLPEVGPVPDDRRVQMLFGPVGRVAASLRDGRWDDPDAAVVPLDIAEVLTVVQSFGCLPIYGWNFFDVHDEALSRWGTRVSLDWRSGDDGIAHSICVFQEDAARFLDLCIWFDHVEIRARGVTPMSVGEFIEGGRRWWDALYTGDPRTEGFGIAPGR